LPSCYGHILFIPGSQSNWPPKFDTAWTCRLKVCILPAFPGLIILYIFVCNWRWTGKENLAQSSHRFEYSRPPESNGVPRYSELSTMGCDQVLCRYYSPPETSVPILYFLIVLCTCRKKSAIERGSTIVQNIGGMEREGTQHYRSSALSFESRAC
jgi:hypothetical protein